MTARPATALVVCALVLVAGCNGLLDASPQPDPTPSAPTVSERTPDSFPPWITGDGDLRVGALVASHTETVEGRSVTVEERRVRRNGSVDELRSTSVYRIDGPRYYAVTRYESSDGDGAPATGRIVAWTNGTVGYLATTRESGTSYEPVTLERPVSPSRNDRLYALLSTLEPELTDRYRTDGNTVYVLRATVPGTVLGLGTRVSGTVSDVAFHARVRADGLIEGYRLRYTVGDGRSRSTTVVETLEFRGLGTTEVPRPPWVDAARGTTSGREAQARRIAGEAPRSEATVVGSVGCDHGHQAAVEKYNTMVF